MCAWIPKFLPGITFATSETILENHQADANNGAAEEKAKEGDVDEAKDDKKDYREEVKSSYGIKRYKFKKLLNPGK